MAPEQAQGKRVDARSEVFSFGAAGLVSYSLACNNTEEAIDWAAKVAEQRFPSFIPVVLRTFEPIFRESPRWPAVLKTMHLT